MQLKQLSLACFRNYQQKNVLFHPETNYIEGENGCGKSTLLEAIYLLSTGKSFRTSRLLELISYEGKEFQIRAEFIKQGISQSIQILFSPEGKKLLFNDTNYTGFLPLLGILPSVLLSSEDIAIISGGPAERRRFLNLHIAQMDPLYLHHLGRYERALKQRNFLLKKGQTQGILPWEELMAISACYLIQKREQTLLSFIEPCNRHILYLSQEKEPFHLAYSSSLTISPDHCPAFYLKQWENLRKKELEQGTSLIGPHRDDISFFLQGKEIKSYGSEGQKRCCLAALRLTQWDHLKKHLEESPLFCIDDFGAHLDHERSCRLKTILKNRGQVFLTAPSFALTQEEIPMQIKAGA